MKGIAFHPLKGNYKYIFVGSNKNVWCLTLAAQLPQLCTKRNHY